MADPVLGVIALLLTAHAPAPSPAKVADPRKLVERSLPFLEKEGVAWLETRKCATCHHIPMMLWTHYEAKKYGFRVNESAMQKLQSQAIAQYLGHPELQPTGQDKGFYEKPFGPGTVYLSLALMASSSPTDEAVKALKRFTANFLKHQNDNGSWTTKINQAPLVDGHDTTTLQILLALSDKAATRNPQAWNKARKWLKDAPPRDEIQPLALRILVAERARDAREVERQVTLLRKKQQANGGWSQKLGLGTDALATGQALYALAAAGVAANDPAVDRARGFLATTQRPDGSWLVHTQNPNSHDPVISYVGTGWATLGLIRTLPKPAP
jgi:hypothetical protein